MTKKRMTSQTSWKLRFKKAGDRTKNIKALFFSATFVAGELEPMAYGGGGGGVEGFDKVHHGLHVYDHGLDVYIKMVIGPVQNCV